MRRHIGHLLMATAILHNLVGVIIFWPPLAAIVEHGLFNAVEPHYDRATVFWFLFSGVMIFILGQLTQWSLLRTGTLPRALGWWLLGLAVVGVVLIPESGFWLVLPQAWLVLDIARAPAAASPQAALE